MARHSRRSDWAGLPADLLFLVLLRHLEQSDRVAAGGVCKVVAWLPPLPAAQRPACRRPWLQRPRRARLRPYLRPLLNGLLGKGLVFSGLSVSPVSK